MWKAAFCGGGGSDPPPGLLGVSCHCHGCVGLALTQGCPGMRIWPRPEPTSKGAPQTMWSTHARLAGLFCQNVFPGVLLPIRPGSPAPSQDRREAAGTCRDELWVRTANTQLLQVGPGSCQFPSFPPWKSDSHQISSHCHLGVVLIILFGPLRI